MTKMTANDDRSNSLNSNHPANKATNDNRSNQLNTNNPRHQGDKGGTKK